MSITLARRQWLVVHFNCLKCCPPDIRLSAEVPAAMQSTPEPLADHSCGSNVEVVDHADDILAPQSLPTPHYPSCTSRPPEYFAECIVHRIRDVHLSERGAV